MFGNLLHSERPVPAGIRLARRLYLSGGIPTVLYKKIAARLLGGRSGIGGDIRVQTHRGPIIINSDDEIGGHIYLFLSYDRNVLGFLRHLFGAGRPATMLDVGGNIGNHSLWLASCFEKVICFEPNPAALEYLNGNVRLHDNIQVVPIGLSLKAGTALLQAGGDTNLGQAGITDHPDPDAIEITLDSGDAWLEKNGVEDVDFIKIDVEGHEWEALNGLRETLRKRSPILLFEYLPQTAQKTGNRIEEFLSDYVLFGLEGLPKSDQFRSMSEGVVLSPFDARKAYNNVLAVPRNRRQEIEGAFPGGTWRNSRFFRVPPKEVL